MDYSSKASEHHLFALPYLGYFEHNYRLTWFKGFIDGLIGASVLFVLPSGEITEGITEVLEGETYPKAQHSLGQAPSITLGGYEALTLGYRFAFGGGLSLAQALKQVGLIQAIGDQFSNLSTVTWFSLGVLTLIALMLTEVMIMLLWLAYLFRW